MRLLYAVLNTTDNRDSKVHGDNVGITWSPMLAPWNLLSRYIIVVRNTFNLEKDKITCVGYELTKYFT